MFAMFTVRTATFTVLSSNVRSRVKIANIASAKRIRERKRENNECFSLLISPPIFARTCEDFVNASRQPITESAAGQLRRRGNHNGNFQSRTRLGDAASFCVSAEGPDQSPAEGVAKGLANYEGCVVDRRPTRRARGAFTSLSRK